MTDAPPGVPLSRVIGLVLGPALAALLFFILPEATRDASGAIVSGLSPAGRMTLAIGAWLAIWWITEAIPIEAAAMLPLAVFPLAGVAAMPQAAAPYADQVVFLFLGGMLMGSALEKWGLHRRLALLVMLRVGTSPARLIAGLLLATAVVSMWVSNTAAAIMMLPIAMGVVALTRQRHEALAHAGSDPAGDRSARNFSIAAMLAVAFGASIGGIATTIGTPPNGVMVGFVSSRFGEQITFARWLALGLPLMLVVLPVAWIILLAVFPMRGLRTHGAHHLLAQDYRQLGPMSRGEWTVLVVFSLAAFAWIFRPQLAEVLGLTRTTPTGTTQILLTDAGIAIAAALLLFLIPVSWKRNSFALDWQTAGRIPWGILLLFGGGLSLAAALEANGVDDYIATLFKGLEGIPPVVVVLIVAAAAVFISEIGSNTAVATVLLPIMATAAPVVGVHPYVLIFAVTLGVSLAFMMPSGTPPNALVFTSGHLRVKDMVKGGLTLNLACVLLITLAAYYLAPAVGLTKAATP